MSCTHWQPTCRERLASDSVLNLGWHVKAVKPAQESPEVRSTARCHAHIHGTFARDERLYAQREVIHLAEDLSG